MKGEFLHRASNPSRSPELLQDIDRSSLRYFVAELIIYAPHEHSVQKRRDLRDCDASTSALVTADCAERRSQQRAYLWLTSRYLGKKPESGSFRGVEWLCRFNHPEAPLATKTRWSPSLQLTGDLPAGPTRAPPLAPPAAPRGARTRIRGSSTRPTARTRHGRSPRSRPVHLSRRPAPRHRHQGLPAPLLQAATPEDAARRPHSHRRRLGGAHTLHAIVLAHESIHALLI